VIPKLRVLVADDEAIARAGLCALLTADPDVDVVAECADGAQAVRALRELRPDVAFLDVQMPALDGFAVLRQIESEYVPTIVFVTAYDRYALRAFDAHAVDYLLKPFEDERFHLALARAKERARAAAAAVSAPSENVADGSAETLAALTGRLAAFLDATERGGGATAAQYPARLVVREAGSMRFVRTADLVWIEAADYYVKLHARGKVHMLRESMGSLEERLDPATFFRVHRSAIVNLDHVRELQPFGRGEHVVILDDETRLRLANTRREELEQRLGDRL
jgi:two-component system, LytTR family, response regulator